ncbi:benzoate-CoA ligase family protein [Streptomyces sp. NPDC005474]|uniref:benzoate-CoA ligase family protein n=1 Tax=Streptomyces sp. NPDC005474 TaxID=3154878 RepID=UPI0034561FE2
MAEPFNLATYLTDRRLQAGDADRTAVVSRRDSLTYRELAEQMRRAAAGLRALGLRPEERVAFITPDGPEMLIGVLATWYTGAVAVPLSTMSTGAELGRLLRDCRARFVVAGSEFAEAVQEAVAEAPDLTVLITVGEPVGQAASTVRWTQLLASGAGGETQGPDATTEESPALWLYTSGTTGTPKAVMHPHASMRHLVEAFGRHILGTRSDDRCYSVSKMFFTYGLANSCYLPLAAGATTILDADRPTPSSIAARLIADRPTLFFAVPTVYAALLRAEELPDDAFASVRLAISAGEMLPARLHARFKERFGVDLVDGLGSTEALQIFMSNRPGNTRPGSSGTPIPGYDVRLVTEDGTDAGPGEPGILWVRGPTMASGYWCRREASRAVFRGEWLVTGDMYTRDEEGYYHCLGRSGDMIKSGGIWVSPSEVEERLEEHSTVAQAAVVAVPDADGLELTVACVVPTPGQEIDPDALIKFCRSGLAAFKRPRRVLEFDVLPTTATGKIQRAALRRTVAALLPRGTGSDPTAAVVPVPQS